MNSLHDEIVAWLRGQSDGAASREIAEQFLKFKSPLEAMAHRAVAAILAADRRCRFDAGSGCWQVNAPAAPESGARLADLPWCAVHLLADAQQRTALHVSVWSVLPQPEHLYSSWLADPASLSPEDRDLLLDNTDSSGPPPDRGEAAGLFAAALDGRTAVFLSSRQHSLALQECARARESLTDDVFMLSTLARAAGEDPPRPLDIDGCCGALLGTSAAGASARRQGRLFAECVAETLARLSRRAVEFREDLETEMRQRPAIDCAGKDFSLDDLGRLPACCGVYAFQQRDGSYLYIGKSTNLRRRVTGYFIKSDESPAKLSRLRAESHRLTTVACGSELESLILEHRLIQKHAPALNAQVDVHERKGSFAPVADCMVLLPHAEPDKGMSFWFRREQRLRMRPFSADFAGEDALADEVTAYFLSDKLAPQPVDFEELEIATRWIKRRRDTLVMVPADRLGSAAEMVEAMKIAWQESIAA
jgi:hypothetical protein